MAMQRSIHLLAGRGVAAALPRRSGQAAAAVAGSWAARTWLLRQRAACAKPGDEGLGRGLAAAAAAAAALAALGVKASSPDAALCEGPSRPVLVVGSLNADIIIEINRFPKEGETLNTRTPDTGVMVPGGKGANQAVAAARLSQGTERQVQFVCQFGNDANAKTLEQVLADNGLDISGCGRADKPSGQAFIFLQANGANSILIVGGSNVAWPSDCTGLNGLIGGASAVLLQREVPEFVNEAVVEAAARAGVPVVQDVGGEERPFSDQLLRRLTYICPNETELERLTGMPTSTEEQIVAAARGLQKKGVKNVLVTMGSDGSLLVDEKGKVLKQGVFAVPGGKVVDTTGAGDTFRAAFTVALVEGKPFQECMKFAAAASSIAVSRMGAIPSLPTRQECQSLMQRGRL